MFAEFHIACLSFGDLFREACFQHALPRNNSTRCEANWHCLKAAFVLFFFSLFDVGELWMRQFRSPRALPISDSHSRTAFELPNTILPWIFHDIRWAIADCIERTRSVPDHRHWALFKRHPVFDRGGSQGELKVLELLRAICGNLPSFLSQSQGLKVKQWNYFYPGGKRAKKEKKLPGNEFPFISPFLSIYSCKRTNYSAPFFPPFS